MNEAQRESVAAALMLAKLKALPHGHWRACMKCGALTTNTWACEQKQEPQFKSPSGRNCWDDVEGTDLEYGKHVDRFALPPDVEALLKEYYLEELRGEEL